MFDLTIFPLSLDAGREQYDLPGLLAVSAPRTAVRLRAKDQLIVYMHITATGGKGLSPAHQQEMLARLAETYFTAPGPVTGGLRAMVTRLNDFLLSRNLRSGQEGQLTASLNIAAVHGDGMILCHAGPTHSFLLTPTQVQHFDDTKPAPGARSLGLGRQATARFYQSTLEQGDILVFTSDPPPAWTSRALTNSPQLSMDQLRRRLLSDAGVELKAGIIRFQPGKGQVNTWKPSERAAVERAAIERGAQAASSQPAAAKPAAAPTRGAQVYQTPPVIPPAMPPAVPPPLSVKSETDSQTEQKETGSVEEPGTAGAPGTASADSPEPGPFSEEPAETTAAESPVMSFEIPGSSPADDPLETTLPGQAALQNVGSQESPEPESAQPEVQGSQSAVYLGGASTAPEAPARPRPRPGTAAGADSGKGQPGNGGIQQTNRPRGQRTIRPTPVQTEKTSLKERVLEWLHAPVGGGASQPRPLQRRGAASVSPTPDIATSEVDAGPDSEAFRRGLASAWKRAGAAQAKVGGAITTAAGKVLPRRTEPFINLTPDTMLVIAIFIPLLVVAVALVVYFRTGRTEEYQRLYNEAQVYAQQAAQIQDPIAQRNTWEMALQRVREAEKFKQTEESAALRKVALDSWDQLQGFVRLNYRTAVRGGFGSTINITRIVATLNDVYLLDSTAGQILHLERLTTDGYQVNPSFVCGPGQAGESIIGQLIDLAALPINNDMHASIMGIDAGGNLVYCSPNKDSFDSRPLALPDMGWGKIAAMATYGDQLFVLDPASNAVYYYDGQNGIYDTPPRLYFDNDIPHMADVIDMAVDQEYLYLLHASGQMTVCESSGFAFSGTKCTDPTPYGDLRAGYEPSPLAFAGSQLMQIQTTQPPDPSIFALDTINRSIYHLSLRRLNLQRQYLPALDSDFPLPNSAPSAFAITPNRRAILAFGNQVFFASLP